MLAVRSRDKSIMGVSPNFFETPRETMLRQLVQRGIRSTRVLAALDRVQRERFVPSELAHMAYADRAVPIGCGQTISQPYIVALMTEALQLSGSEHVLEIGTGSGYQTAILAELAASVVSLERHAELSARAEQALTACGYQNITLAVGDGTQGWAERAPYDRILVAAAASHIPPALEAQLAESGILVIPIGDTQGQVLQAFHKVAGQLHAEHLTSCRFVPLVGAQTENE
jgi:protein-L-isoaspartate(D-aspartate) O-methyltransferase